VNTQLTGPEAGAQLRAARERRGWTRAQLAARAGRSYAQIGQIEAGAVPRRSGVLLDAWAALESRNPALTRRAAEEVGDDTAQPAA
jgi:transcriptional regulator with XRE-family HTH domain